MCQALPALPCSLLLCLCLLTFWLSFKNNCKKSKAFAMTRPGGGAVEGDSFGQQEIEINPSIWITTSTAGAAQQQSKREKGVAAGAAPRCQSSSSTTTTATTTRTWSSNIICWLCGHFDWQSLNSFCSASCPAPPLPQLCMTCNLTSCRLISSAQIWQKLMSLLIKLQIHLQIEIQMSLATEIKIQNRKAADTAAS